VVEKFYKTGGTTQKRPIVITIGRFFIEKVLYHHQNIFALMNPGGKT
jgi:hypothetical protein